MLDPLEVNMSQLGQFGLEEHRLRDNERMNAAAKVLLQLLVHSLRQVLGHGQGGLEGHEGWHRHMKVLARAYCLFKS